MSPQGLSLAATREFEAWYRLLGDTEKTRIDARLERMSLGHLGDSKSLGERLFELRWKNGMRVYYSRRRIRRADVIVVWGGTKSTQRSDIKRARRLKAIYEEELGPEPKDA